MERLKAADEDGLDPADYPLPDRGLRKDAPPAQWAEADVKLSLAAIRYARDARGARIDPAAPLGARDPEARRCPAVDEVLSRVSAAEDAGAALASYNPPHAGYRALKERLAQLRESHPSQPSVRLPKGPTLRVGMKDPRVPLIRARFNLAKDRTTRRSTTSASPRRSPPSRRRRACRDTGVLNAQTVAALSGPSVAQREARADRQHGALALAAGRSRRSGTSW